MLKRARIFPADFTDICSLPELIQGELPPVVIAGTESEIAEAARRIIQGKIQNMPGSPREDEARQNQFILVRTSLSVRTSLGEVTGLYISLQGDDWEIFVPPMESMSKDEGSKATYYAAHEKLGLLVHDLPPYSETSPHENPWWEETFCCVAGKATLCTEQGDYQLAEDVVPVIRTGIGHQLHTESEPAIFVLKIQGDRNWLRRWKMGEAHIHLKSIQRCA